MARVRYYIFAQVLFISLFVSGFNSLAVANDQSSLKIMTGSGAYKLSQAKAFFDPFETKTGTKVFSETTDEALDLLKGWQGRSQAGADVINLNSYEAEMACAAGYLVSFVASDLEQGANGESIRTDFMANSLMDCAIPHVAWSALMVVDHTKFKKRKPRSWADFFNGKAFKGKRSLKKSARYTLEMALLSKGIAPGDVYASLEQIKYQKIAFAQLDKIKNQIVWWEKSSEAIANLQQDDVSMGLAYNGRLFHAMIAQGLEVTYVWKGQIYDFDYWGIPLNSKNQAKAKAFVKFATAPQQLAVQSSYMPYGPMRASALRFVKEHKIANIHMVPYLPTTKTHFHSALKFNELWWRSKAGKALEKQFSNWLSGTLTFDESP